MLLWVIVLLVLLVLPSSNTSATSCPPVLSSNDVPRWIATNYWTANFSTDTAVRKRQLERVSKVLKLPWHICTGHTGWYLRLIYPIFLLDLISNPTQKEKPIWYWKFSKNRYYKSGPRPHIYEAECCNCWICQNCTDVQLVRSNLTGILTYLVVTHDGGIGATWFQKLKLFTASHQKLMIFHFRLMFQQFSTLELRNMFDWPNQVWYTCGPFSSSDADKDDRVKC